MIIKKGKVFSNGALKNIDIVVEDGKIASIESNVTGPDVFNAAGLIVLPGLIDSHVHFRDPGETKKEDFLTGSRAAAAGGVTTVLDMPNNKPPITSVKALRDKREIARKSMVNYGFHFGATENNLDEIKRVIGVAAVKTVMGATTGGMVVENLESLKAIFQTDKHIIVHAEDSEIMKRNEKKYHDEHDPAIHAKIRSSECAATAVRKAVGLAGSFNTKLHIAHTSTADEMKILSEQKGKSSITCEVTPHHLFMDIDDLHRLGNFAKMNPPLRSRNDVDALWRGIHDGTVDIIASDHAPHLAEEKVVDYWDAPSGVPGVETTLPLMLNAINQKRLSLQQLVSLTSTRPAKIFGIKNKGNIAPGMDADLVLIDLKKEKIIKNSNVVSKCEWTPFDGVKVKGVPVATIVNGEIAYNDDEFYSVRGKEIEVDG